MLRFMFEWTDGDSLKIVAILGPVVGGVHCCDADVSSHCTCNTECMEIVSGGKVGLMHRWFLHDEQGGCLVRTPQDMGRPACKGVCAVDMGALEGMSQLLHVVTT